jgi:very-short-patch-repair endonuclease
MSFPHDPEIKMRARELRKNMTPWERTLWYEFLKEYRPRFQRQKMIGHYVMDFYCAAARLAVELDGGQHFTDRGPEKDAQRTEEIGRYGVKVIRFSNRDVTDHFSTVCETIHRVVKSRLPMPPSEEGGGPKGRKE